MERQKYWNSSSTFMSYSPRIPKEPCQHPMVPNMNIFLVGAELTIWDYRKITKRNKTTSFILFLSFPTSFSATKHTINYFKLKTPSLKSQLNQKATLLNPIHKQIYFPVSNTNIKVPILATFSVPPFLLNQTPQWWLSLSTSNRYSKLTYQWIHHSLQPFQCHFLITQLQFQELYSIFSN